MYLALQVVRQGLALPVFLCSTVGSELLRDQGYLFHTYPSARRCGWWQREGDASPPALWQADVKG